MSSSEWQHELKEANTLYDAKRISRKTYETRVKMAIYMIDKEGDTDIAEKISRAHGYSLSAIKNEFSD
ncbi:hypothetical protein [Clostridium beijerinckii]|uniref:hypothetical protein n=1 Tax=Clostridium beijerinckii TaxID=1520 RepID=UPI001F1F887A|nr:hypothetical protein [Clostridium beijerinckii]